MVKSIIKEMHDNSESMDSLFEEDDDIDDGGVKADGIAKKKKTESKVS